MEPTWCSDIEPGHRITVEVESLFEEGIVVTYHGRDGTELKGALLGFSACKNCSQQQPSVVSAEGHLANPLTYLHDHPYPKLKQYAKHLSRNIPPDVMLKWNVPPTSTDLPLPNNLHSITKRRYAPAKDAVVSVDYNKVAVSTPPTNGDYIWPYTVPYSGSGRRAKFEAQIKLQSEIAEMRKNDAKYLKALEPARKKRKQIHQSLENGSSKKEGRTLVLQPPRFYSHSRNRRKTNESIHDSGVSSDHESPLLKTHSTPNSLTSRKFRSLKDFSIPLRKISLKDPAALSYTSTPTPLLLKQPPLDTIVCSTGSLDD